MFQKITFKTLTACVALTGITFGLSASSARAEPGFWWSADCSCWYQGTDHFHPVQQACIPEAESPTGDEYCHFGEPYSCELGGILSRDLNYGYCDTDTDFPRIIDFLPSW